MAAAWDLCRAGHDVTIYEAAEYVGGLASGFKEPGWDWSVEKFYHHWFASDRHMLGLIKELGMGGQGPFPAPADSDVPQGEFLPVRFHHQGTAVSGAGIRLQQNSLWIGGFVPAPDE